MVDYGEKWSIWSISVDFDENPGGDPWFSSIRALPIVTRSLLLWGFGFSLLFMYQKGGGGWGVKSWGGGGREFGPYPFRDGKMPNEQVLTT